MKHLTKVIFLLFFLVQAEAWAWPARVVKVSDGDTITIQREEPVEEEKGKSIKVRLYGIDVPERKQSYGNSSRIWVSEMILGKIVDVEAERKPDQYGRMLAKIRLADGRSLQGLMVSAGVAWVYERYCPKKDADCQRWRGLQRQAQNRKLGLWVEEDVEAPWEWRKKRKKKK